MDVFEEDLTPEELIEAVRGIIGDDEEPYTFSDAQVSAALIASQSNILIASAILLEKAAAEFALQYISVRTDDLQVDGANASKILMERANRLRDQAQKDQDVLDDFFEVVYPPYCDRFEYEERFKLGPWPWAY